MWDNGQAPNGVQEHEEREREKPEKNLAEGSRQLALMSISQHD